MLRRAGHSTPTLGFLGMFCEKPNAIFSHSCQLCRGCWGGGLVTSLSSSTVAQELQYSSSKVKYRSKVTLCSLYLTLNSLEILSRVPTSCVQPRDLRRVGDTGPGLKLPRSDSPFPHLLAVSFFWASASSVVNGRC